MSFSVFLGQVLGSFLVLMCGAMLLHRERMKKLMQNILENPALMVLAGNFTLLIGLLVIISHNIWVKSWIGMVTFTGWLFFIHGVCHLFFPEACNKCHKEMLHKNRYLWSTIILFAIGCYLAYMAFYKA